MHFFVKTQNPRPSFHLDMTDDERAIMQRHVTYWSEKATQGIAIVFGPVMDPNGVYGIGIYQIEDEVEMRTLLQADPQMASCTTTYSPCRVRLLAHPPSNETDQCVI